jgi:hypothetical protein
MYKVNILKKNRKSKVILMQKLVMVHSLLFQTGYKKISILASGINKFDHVFPFILIGKL